MNALPICCNDGPVVVVGVVVVPMVAVVEVAVAGSMDMIDYLFFAAHTYFSTTTTDGGV